VEYIALCALAEMLKNKVDNNKEELVKWRKALYRDDN
jgi:hypothetical protein